MSTDRWKFWSCAVQIFTFHCCVALGIWRPLVWADENPLFARQHISQLIYPTVLWSGVSNQWEFSGQDYPKQICVNSFESCPINVTVLRKNSIKIGSDRVSWMWPNTCK